MGCSRERVCLFCAKFLSSSDKISELVVKMVNTLDMTRVLHLTEQTRPVKHVAFDHSGSTLAVSCSDGIVYIYSVSHEVPKLVKRIDGLIKTMETDVEACCRVIWHPDGKALAVPTGSRCMRGLSAVKSSTNPF